MRYLKKGEHGWQIWVGMLTENLWGCTPFARLCAYAHYLGIILIWQLEKIQRE